MVLARGEDGARVIIEVSWYDSDSEALVPSDGGRKELEAVPRCRVEPGRCGFINHAS